jgi:murein DD-endopeptidase MepM/ murein hydrolase activator NlpD
MPQIDIHIERPRQTLALAGAIVALLVHGSIFSYAADSMGGDASRSTDPVFIANNAQADMAHLREQQTVLSKREEILRGQLALLEQQMQGEDSEDMSALMNTRDELTQLLLNRSAAEKKIVEALHEFWAAEGYAYDASNRTADANGIPDFAWPVAPTEGISARFDDPAYEDHFGMPHHAVDIPVLQGTVIGAAADGVVVKVSDQGMGFNSLVIRHAGGFSTLYGHVTSFLVREGQEVRAGDPIALSGGKPGTKGAGLMTTGSHVHFAIYKAGVAVDPLLFLPSASTVR